MSIQNGIEECKSDSSSNCISFTSTSYFSVRPSASSLDQDEIPFEDTLAEGNRHCVHGMVWAPWNSLVLNKYQPKAAILMQMRFDGHIGFPGGIVDDSISGLPVHVAKQKVTDAFVRELEEEVNFDPKEIEISSDNYAFTCQHPTKKNTFLHFYSIKISLKALEVLELAALKSPDFASEVMGNMRVPLYTMFDGFRGFPAFLNNIFIGNARSQLLIMCQRMGIMSTAEIMTALEASANSVNFTQTLPL